MRAAGKRAAQRSLRCWRIRWRAEEYGIGFRKEDYALGMKVQQTLDEMIEDGKFAEISKKWFGEDKALKDAEYYSEVEATDGSWDKVKEAGELVMGLDDSFPPMGLPRR